MPKFTKFWEKVDFIGVLYQFIAKCNLKTPALKH